MKYQNAESQNEKHRNLSSYLGTRKLTPEEGTSLVQEAKKARERYEKYLIQIRKKEAHKTVKEKVNL